ncbi:MAG: insulinase family protein [Burkholderiales bacterium]|nr:insulinase family protein [Burkholderiales bacterium]
MRVFLLVSLSVVTLGWFALCGDARAGSAPVHDYRLDNGMRILVKEDHRAPVAVSMVWYGAGSVDEFNGTTGVAHVLEHMMFKGTEKVPGGEFSRRIARAGGRDNAFTSRDYTAYFQTLHRDRLPLAIEMEADRMTGLVLTKEEFEKEIQVVMEERRWRTDDRPQSLVYEALMATAFQAHPYRHPIIGWMNDLQNMRVDDARDWYGRWYAPNNAILVVVGDVSGEEVLGLARKHFGPIPARALPQRKPQVESAQIGPRRVVVKAPSELPSVLMAYRVPKLRDPENDWEPYALEVLEGVLDGHEGARLAASLVRGTRLAAAAGAGYQGTGRGPGLFLLSATPSEGRTVAEAETALKAEIARIATEGIQEDELARVKAQVVAAQIYARDSMFAQARQMGALETIGLSHRSIDIQVERIRRVTAEQVQDVAKRHFQNDVLTVAVLDPQPLGGKRPAPPPPGVRH